uniref:Leucine-rich repeat-containing protein 51 n=1 Tax=Naja naja TaxID=35670 RepID=A0A8C6XQ98_NAJNA
MKHLKKQGSPVAFFFLSTFGVNRENLHGLLVQQLPESGECTLHMLQNLLTEEPRPGLRPIRRLEGGRLLTQAVRLNNNTLSDLTDFPDIMEKLLEYPLDIYWIDLSFNDLPSIDPVLTTFYNLRNLNLHGNSIQQLSEVDKLAVLPHLRNLTLHGNPIEEEKGYR